MFAQLVMVLLQVWRVANVSMPGCAVLCWAGWCYNQTLDPRQVKLEAGHDTKITKTSCSATVTVQRDDKY